MLSRFDLKPGVDKAAFAQAYARMGRAMVARDMLVSAAPVGERIANTPMDTDADDASSHYSIMTFRDRAQLDAAYDYVLRPAVEADEHEAHRFVNRSCSAPVFTCWEDAG